MLGMQVCVRLCLHVRCAGVLGMRWRPEVKGVKQLRENASVLGLCRRGQRSHTGTCDCDSNCSDRWIDCVPVHFRENDWLHWRHTLPVLCSSDPLWHLLRCCDFRECVLMFASLGLELGKRGLGHHHRINISGVTEQTCWQCA